MEGLVSILGGTGSAATVDLFNKFVILAAAQRDQEHIPLIVSSTPDILGRTDALVHRGHSPLPTMRDCMHKLEDAGAECIVIPCNTAHFWFNELKECCHTELLSIVETTINEVKSCRKSYTGLLATNAILYVGLYQEGIESLGLTCVNPDLSNQEKVMESIYCLKAGDLKRARTLMNEQAGVLFSCGAQIVVPGYIEVPAILIDAVRKSPDKYAGLTGSLVCVSIKRYERRVGEHHLLVQ